MKSFVSAANLKKILQSFKVNINSIIGTDTLNTTNKTLTGAINELNDAIGNTPNTSHSKKLKNFVTLTANTTEITTGVNYDPTKNIMMVFVNGLYIEEGKEYNITSNNTKIKLTTQLTASPSSPVIVRFVVINGIINTALVNVTKTLTGEINELEDATNINRNLYIKKLKNSVTLTTNTTEITTGVSYDPTKNIMMVFVNGLYIEEGEEYKVTSNNTKITLTTQLTASSSSPVIVRFIVITF